MRDWGPTISLAIAIATFLYGEGILRSFKKTGWVP
jgi:hypothetical protein